MKLIICVFEFAAVLALAAGAQAQKMRPVQTFDTSAGPVKITPVYHASLEIEAGGKVIVIDPAKPANFAGLPQADLILVTDIHGDHLDEALLKSESKDGTEIIAPDAVAKKVTAVKVTKVIGNGEKTIWGAWTIEAIPMYNTTPTRGPEPGKLFHDKGRGNGYVLTYGGKRFYFSGDTEGIPEMRALKNIDVAFVCMNLPYTMTPEEAADAVKAFHPKVAIPYHYKGQDTTVFKKALDGTGIEVRLIDWYPSA
jgi:L-ascorbate metabolism protein UlaG (beta-lactamase superfamily)